MRIETAALLTIATVNLMFAAVIITRSLNNKQNLLFGATIVGNVLWAVGDAILIGATQEETVRIWSRLFYIAPMFTAYFLVLFSIAFPENKRIRPRYLFGLMVPMLVLAIPIAADSSFLIGTVNVGGSALNSIDTNTGRFLLYSLYFNVYFILSYIILYKNAVKAVGTMKTQAAYVLIAAFVSSVLAVITNVTLPLNGNSNYIWLGPVFTVFYVALVSYAIMKHKLFDIRAAVARVMTYVFTSGVLIGIYAGGAYFLGALVVGLGASSYQVIVNIGLTVGLILVYPYLKKAFDKLTNKLFFREAYDAQTFIDELNKTLVSGVDLDTLLTKIALIIQENMKSSYCTFYIRKTSYLPARMLGAHRDSKDFADIEVISESAKQLKVKVFDSESQYENENDKKLASELRDNDASVLIRLVDTVEYEVNGIGYIFVGPKRSGGLYSKKDLKIFEIIANELVVAVESALRFEEIEQFNVTLQKKIDDATKQLRKTNEKLQALDTAKDEFISMASHQLRTPLTSVKGYISMIMDGDLGEVTKQQKKMLDQAFISSQRMVYLIADLLNVSRLRTGKFSIEAHPTNLADVVEGEIAQLVGAAEARGLKLKYKKPAKFELINIDETKIRQVIMNFVDNAIYYTPSGGTITANLKLTKTSLEFTVVDTGMGVPKKEVPHLFTKFYRAGNAKQARPDGTGIGLFMAKKVIIASGGSVVFKTKEGKGSTFGFLLPLSKIKLPK